MWVLIPGALVTVGGLPVSEHWKVYLPAVLMAFAVMIPAIIVAERREKLKPVFNAAIVLLVVVQLGLYGAAGSLGGIGVWLTLFFVAFNILEATQPSWISRIAPPSGRATAMGIYNTLQSLGLFLGGALGGWLAQRGGGPMVHVVCTLMAFIWLIVAWTMKPPAPRPARATTAST